MLQKMIIEIDTDKPLNSYGDGHMLVYDATTGRYYITTRESFLSVQNKKIAELEKEIDEAKQENEAFKKECEYLIGSIEQKFNEFLATYKETNAKMIAMIKTVVTEE